MTRWIPFSVIVAVENGRIGQDGVFVLLSLLKRQHLAPEIAPVWHLIHVFRSTEN
ncbi:hypothetical protein [Pseudoflavitalea rhizosphaerae]|uniref:hypothetical protein n=1 Tax=Pseudoflavitalea rhizosphaerae TaxID=1884793 RepID=UPI0013E0D028|nr:hypothetical protein [Pseudoflavitalea rhizosphaerae]